MLWILIPRVVAIYTTNGDAQALWASKQNWYIMKEIGYPGLINYIDDLIQCDSPSKIQQEYQVLINFCKSLDFPVS